MPSHSQHASMLLMAMPVRLGVAGVLVCLMWAAIAFVLMN